MVLSKDVLAALRCPRCHGALADLACRACGTRYSSADGVPVLIDETTSMFRAADVKPPTGPIGGLGRFLPSVSRNVKAERNYRAFADALGGRRVLIVGGRVLGEGMEALVERDLELVETDVALGPRTQLVCDAHALPFADETFDGVVVQAVLEHVVDPVRCVAEIYRVLRRDGVVYAETPFMQQVHAGPYDFTRFTHVGHRRLFRKFEELDSGATCGPGMALAWSFTSFLQSFASSRLQRSAARALGHALTFPLKYVDDYLIDRPGALDAASAVYFLGRKSEHELRDEELPRAYRGMDHR